MTRASMSELAEKSYRSLVGAENTCSPTAMTIQPHYLFASALGIVLAICLPRLERTPTDLTLAAVLPDSQTLSEPIPSTAGARSSSVWLLIIAWVLFLSWTLLFPNVWASGTDGLVVRKNGRKGWIWVGSRAEAENGRWREFSPTFGQQLEARQPCCIFFPLSSAPRSYTLPHTTPSSSAPPTETCASVNLASRYSAASSFDPAISRPTRFLDEFG